MKCRSVQEGSLTFLPIGTLHRHYIYFKGIKYKHKHKYLEWRQNRPNLHMDQSSPSLSSSSPPSPSLVTGIPSLWNTYLPCSNA